MKPVEPSNPAIQRLEESGCKPATSANPIITKKKHKAMQIIQTKKEEQGQQTRVQICSPSSQNFPRIYRYDHIQYKATQFSSCFVLFLFCPYKCTHLTPPESTQFIFPRQSKASTVDREKTQGHRLTTATIRFQLENRGSPVHWQQHASSPAGSHPTSSPQPPSSPCH